MAEKLGTVEQLVTEYEGGSFEHNLIAHYMCKTTSHCLLIRHFQVCYKNS